MKVSEININLPISSQEVWVWIDWYLRGIGKNTWLADGLLLAQRFWVWPLLLPLSKIHRCCGPEDTMEYQVSQQRFDEKIERIVWYIDSNNQMEPIICEYKDSKLSIRDGNHRYEALKQLWLWSYRVVIRSNSQEEYQSCIDCLSSIMS